MQRRMQRFGRDWLREHDVPSAGAATLRQTEIGPTATAEPPNR